MPYKRGHKWVAEVRRNGKRKQAHLRDQDRGSGLGSGVAEKAARRLGGTRDDHGILTG